VVKDGEIIYSTALGSTAREDGKPVTAQTRFAIGSMGKQFTATMVMLPVRIEIPIRARLR
jgi:CubicO group peptidase (beta-lactamase class C family)